MTNLYEEYALLESQIAALELKKEHLRPHLLQMMIEKSQKKIETAVGSFSVSMLKKWKYPAKVTELGEKFKEAQAKAQSTGEATFEEQPSLRFNAIKI